MVKSFEKDYFKFYDGLSNFRKLRDKVLLRIIKNYYNKGCLLDIGCGYGDLLNHFKKQDFKLYGIDISSFAIRKAKKMYPYIHFKVADAQRFIPFKIKFDAVMAIDVIEHLNNPLKALKNIRSKIKQGGYLFIQMPFVSNRLNKWFNDKILSIDKTHVFIPSLDNFLLMADKAGFKPVKFYISIPPLIIRLPRRLASTFCLTFVILKAV